MKSSREQVGWYFYDWANSAYSSTVVTLLLGAYLADVAGAAADVRGFVHPFGIPIFAPSYWGFLVSLSVVTQVIALPLAGAVADRSRSKKRLLGLFAYIGAGATMLMYFIAGGAYVLGGALFLVSNLALGASVVVYNSFLPEIATEKERDEVSSKGWGIGYLGGGLLLAFNLALAAMHARFGLTEAEATRINLLSAGVWWAAFTVVPLLALKNRARTLAANGGLGVRGAFAQFGRTLRDLRNYPEALTFLLAYLLYNDAVQAVLTLAGEFGHGELKLSMAQLALDILMVQFVAFLGAIAFNYIARAAGAKRAILGALAAWIAVTASMYLVRSAVHFFIASAVVAVIMGGTQALSRSLFSLMIPKRREAEYFGLYEISDKGTSWICPLIFAATLQATRSYRSAILTLIVFFFLGAIVLARVNVRRGARAAVATEPRS